MTRFPFNIRRSLLRGYGASAAIVWLVAPALGCGTDETVNSVHVAAADAPQTLSSYSFFTGNLADLVPAQGVVPYEVISPLWSDGARKDRFIALPKGAKAGFTTLEDWVFPEGSTIIKTFSFPNDRRDLTGPKHIVETRLLVRTASTWRPLVYLWNDSQTEAVLSVGGSRADVSYLDEKGDAVHLDYVVPNVNQCLSCHGRDDVVNGDYYDAAHEVHLLGTITPQLNRDVVKGGKTVNQLTWMSEQGVFAAALPAASSLTSFADPLGTDPIDARARSYLHANCSHCHRPGGSGSTSGLVLLDWVTTPAMNGICKTPVAAGAGTGGRPFDIVPGDPSMSILPFRMNATEPEIKMPQIPNRTPDPNGVALISDWIQGMPAMACASN